MKRRLLPLILLLLTSACTSECIEPGEGISHSDIKIDIPVVIDGADERIKSSLWVDSNIDVNDDEILPITVRGTIDFCADTPERVRGCANPKICNKVIVPAIFCSDGSKLNYAASNIADPSIACAHSGGAFASQGLYVDGGVKVNPGDRLKFNLVPSETIKVTDCNNIPSSIVNYSFADLEKLYLTNKSKQSLSEEDSNFIQDIIDNKLSVACEQGLDFIEISGSAGTFLRLEKFKGNTYDVYVDNSFAPTGNKVFFTTKFATKWNAGALVDVRSLLSGSEYDYSCDSPINPNLLRFDTYDVNYRCGNICGDNIRGSDCISSLRYKWVEGTEKCKKFLNDSTGLNKCKVLPYPMEKWANLLIAKISEDDVNGILFMDRGQQCLPSNSTSSLCIDFNDSSSFLQLDHSYLVSDSVSPGMKVWMGIADTSNDYGDNSGGYHVEIKRSCVHAEGHNLYMYIGSDPDSVAPGDPGTDHIYIEAEAQIGSVVKTGKFSINAGGANNGNEPKSGRVYFGINGGVTSDTAKDNFRDADNKYIVSIHRVVWSPIFSDLFKAIRGYIVKVLYGTDGGIADININNPVGLISATYTKMLNHNLIQFVQALLVLYIAFSGIFFMLGLIQKTQAELMIRIIKIGVVLSVISPSSWELFGVTLFTLFVKGVDQIVNIFSGSIGSDTGFVFLDSTMGTLLTKEAWLRLTSIMFSGPIGFVAFLLLMWGLWTFIGAIITAVITYLLSMIAMALLLILAPLFIITILFKVTNTLFEGWIKMMLGISLTPIIMFSALAFLHQIMMAAFFAINNFTACRGCAFNMKFDIGDVPIEICPVKLLVPSTYVSDYGVQDHLHQFYASSGENVFGLPFNFVAVLVFIIVAFAIDAFVQIAENMAKDISGTMQPNFTGGGASTSATQGLLSLVGQDQATKNERSSALRSGNVDPSKVSFKAKSDKSSGETRELRDISDSKHGGGAAKRIDDRSSSEGSEVLSSRKISIAVGGSEVASFSSNNSPAVAGSGGLSSSEISIAVDASGGLSSSKISIAVGGSEVLSSSSNNSPAIGDSEVLSSSSNNSPAVGDSEVLSSSSNNSPAVAGSEASSNRVAVSSTENNINQDEVAALSSSSLSDPENNMPGTVGRSDTTSVLADSSVGEGEGIVQGVELQEVESGTHNEDSTLTVMDHDVSEPTIDTNDGVAEKTNAEDNNDSTTTLDASTETDSRDVAGEDDSDL